MEFTYTLSEIDTIAEKILPYLHSKVVIFKGGMGFGKTTLIKALVRALGSTDNVSSPTFSLVNPYEGANDKIYHFDFYRIKNEEEAFDIGFEEYLYSGDWCFIEWAERVEKYLPETYTIVELIQIDKNHRKLRISELAN
ncbi:tRNA (adenosine(37)-N6)-threonylcarbamoyltransferase complex ATPase subunit type 1 TsaE [Capnocytophaga sputigena]|uniref:tRNA threonylcarbamoyladenosine biosynthesis protein TsaE n=1 Tax=Capnocytophaga sputigena TaxID=1019 RepID=A0AAX2I9T1_CAPSP|nr:tRNA (adenosine(37)-N6)-threonylcarbamoyltransferase complex ATPase subunit type 1 TsaE [Capnocytophaga sputigena]ATA83863.1 tRNA (adenosine(37)-N6)-threonylcarbamoyltransferase complex ATPase subunit type 1 TsaE [Capnocytophaga sputigena]EEB67005.1 hydrolase, P-loop family [Capnocytophaga sputigena ATCC 33612]SQA75192.1 ADP-binding protein [Capnocytophaga sputigena]